MRTLDQVMDEPWEKNFPRAIQIETNSACNSRCTYCPYEKTSRKFEQSVLDGALFSKILSEIQQQKPQVIAPYLNNEPLLDKEIIGKIRKIRQALPGVFIDFATNGSLLTPEISEKLLDSNVQIDEIKINIPATNPEQYKIITGLDFYRTLENVRSFVAMAKEKGFVGRHRIVIVSSINPEDDVNFWNAQGITAKVYKKISRGGIIDTGMAVKDETWGCKYDREKEWLHILSTGQVVLCCMDWNREHILGDLNTNSVSEVWNSKKFQSLRKNVQHSQNKGFICNRCEWGIDYAK